MLSRDGTDKARALGRGRERDNGADKSKAADARDVAPAVTIDDTKRGSSVDTQASRRPLEYPLVHTAPTYTHPCNSKK